MTAPPSDESGGASNAYECAELDISSLDTLQSIYGWVGYEAGSTSGQDVPIIYAAFCCGQPPSWPPTQDTAASLPLPSGATGARALSLDPGDITNAIGYAELPSGERAAVLWSASGVTVLAAATARTDDAAAYAENSCGWIVGESGLQMLGGAYPAPYATLWLNGTPYELQQLLARGSPGLFLTSARWINGAGAIGVVGFIANAIPQGTLDEHEFLLIPTQPVSCPT